MLFLFSLILSGMWFPISKTVQPVFAEDFFSTGPISRGQVVTAPHPTEHLDCSLGLRKADPERSWEHRIIIREFLWDQQLWKGSRKGITGASWLWYRLNNSSRVKLCSWNDPGLESRIAKSLYFYTDQSLHVGLPRPSPATYVAEPMPEGTDSSRVLEQGLWRRRSGWHITVPIIASIWYFSEFFIMYVSLS